jgi:uncharacterized protein involved in type VI secretion and phage assembly
MTEPGGRTYYGKYAGTVVNNIDPEMTGRLLVEVPGVLGLAPSSWAEACVPLAGPTGLAMGVYLVPPIGAGVWVEFAQGDPERPIWVGCRWGSTADLPEMAHVGVPATPSIVLQTATKNTIVISDVPGPTGGIMLRAGASVLTVTLDGISLVAPKVQITAATITLVGTTDVNAGALHVT